MIKYKEFKIVDVFDVKNTHSILKEWITSNSGKYPYVTASENNNSIATHIIYDMAQIEKGNSIMIGGKTLVITYQPQDYFSNDSHNLALYLKDKKWQTEKVQLFLVTVLNKCLKPIYTWGNSISKEKIQKDTILLPTTSQDEIDFSYMEKYISELENEWISELENYLKTTKLDSFILTDEEKLFLKRYRNNEVYYHPYKLGDVFEVKSNPQLDKCYFNFSENGKFPYFTRTVLNNGILGYVDYLDDKHKIDGNCFAVGMLGMKFFYMDKDFYAGQFTKNVRPKNFHLTEEMALFFKCEFDKKSSFFASVLVRDFEKTFNETPLLLPTTNENAIDFDFITKFIRIQKKLAIKNVIEWKDTIINTTKKLCH